MKKIGLVTYYNSNNYGALLQAYALQNAIIQNNCECILVSHDRFSSKKKELAHSSQSKSLKLLQHIMTGLRYPRSLFILGTSQSKEIKRGKHLKLIKCAAFRQKYFSNSTEVFYYTSEQIKNDPPECDAFVCGSDQIWNPERFEGAGPYFLDFVPEDRERIAYAPSVAMTYIPESMKDGYRSLISKFSDVSVREKKGCKAIEEATGIRPEWVMDPTFLLSQDEWQSFSNVPVDAPEIYIFCYFLGKENLLRSRKIINRIAHEYNAKAVVLPFGEHKADSNWVGSVGVGPREFVALIRKAQYVLTDSFHGTALSILLNKNFNVYAGMDTATYANRFDRIENVLQICDLCDRKYTCNTDLRIDAVNYDSVNRLLVPMIEKSRSFLKQALDKVSEKKSLKHYAPRLAAYEVCTGCSACFATCPSDAITMEQDAAGFWRPHIDELKCVHCGKCERACPIENPSVLDHSQNKYYAIYAKNPDLRKKGSSGNAFGLFAKAIAQNNGEVYGASLSEDCRSLSFHSLSEVGLEKLQKSKYLEAEMGNVISSIRNSLESGKNVLFTGTPCQAAGVRKIFGSHPNLMICDFICHGVCSASWYEKYIAGMESKYGAKVKDIQFRSKALGWRLYCMKIDFSNGITYLKTQFSDPYYIDFFKNRHLRTSCYSCNRVIHSYADLTIGDYWAVNVKRNMQDTNEGISVVCARTKQGHSFISKIFEDRDGVFMQPLNEDDVDETFVFRVRKVPSDNDILPDKFPMKPKLGKKDLLRKIYYEYYVRGIKLRR